MGEAGQAIRYAEESRGLNDNPYAIARECEDILLSGGMMDEAFERYVYEADIINVNLEDSRFFGLKIPGLESLLQNRAEKSSAKKGLSFKLNPLKFMG